ncbi:dihydrofolate reductase [Agrobacterium tumefaciens]|uniref:2-hydroxyacid dehydrogenase n=1 Tax=Agrobacterium fabrum (strain C58 / ATCC 33970) TaxID=176299 RepID=A9CH04_AGRFC|nr:2-hydroxyacid dehydrogenase [Agrobacterium fabrum]KEY54110.1 dihydrofolate reductase [Agrobacterium tumefaciens]AAK88759.1 2-hydroxyacid dehydrogenase [Agrobacterium fabrum str. C58]KJX85570.1 Hydroxypyruvate reductase [Agrobacterium tumefaciens]MCX2876459.1 2-hydroxyacid dehydrogenase [Agrobacterium fabrum]NMV71981.1 2-hydroxyacid dehydrogenase [Agrobacterium fabrum]
MTAEIVQLCPLIPALEEELAQRFTVHRLFEAADKAAFLSEKGAAIRGVVTGGHIGLPADVGAALPNLEIVAINGVGFDKVDLGEAKRRGFRVSNTPDVLTADVADLALGLVLAQARKVPQADQHVRTGQWLKGDMGLSTRVAGRRYGIFGLGRIGQAIAKRLEGFDARISYTARNRRDVAYDYHDSIEELAANCDVLIIAAAATAETRHIVNADVLKALGPQGVLVNVARGSLVDEKALVEALSSGMIGGAALDVFEDEPRVPEALFAFENVTLAPHIGSGTHQTRRAMADLVLANLDAHFAGRELPTPVV